MGRICKPTYTQTKQIPHLGTTPRSPTLGCTTHRLDTTKGHHLRISTIPPINTDIEEDTSTQEENNTDPSNMANSHMAQQLLQSSSHNSPEQTTIHTNTTETHMETQETTHTENTIPTKKLAVRFNEFLQQHRPTFATDNQQWDKVCQELIQQDITQNGKHTTHSSQLKTYPSYQHGQQNKTLNGQITYHIYQLQKQITCDK